MSLLIFKTRVSALLLLALAVLLSAKLNLSVAQSDRVSAFLDRTEIYEGETVLLTIEVAGRVVGDSPDVGQLTSNFQILDSQRNSQVEIVDGQHRSKDQWTFELEPKQTGLLTIPAMAIGSQLRTPALELSVLPINPQVEQEELQSDDDGIFIEISAEPMNPYVQSQVRYTERLFYSVALREGSLSHTEPPQDLSMESVGEEITYVAERDGMNYRVIERSYALFPQKSGEINIPNVVFRGRVAQGTRSNGQRERFVTRGRQVRVAAERLVLNVRPRPDDYSGEYWLPSPELSLQETWSQQPPQFRVGEPVTRTLILQARGLNANQLPELTVPSIPEANSYPDQVLRETRQDGTWLVSRVEQRLAIVPTESGEFELPEIRLTWWDSQKDSEQVAIIPAQTITVEPAAIDDTEDNVAADPPDHSEAVPTSPTPSLLPDLSTETEVFYWRLSSILLLALWLLTLIGWRRERSRSGNRPVGKATAKQPSFQPNFQPNLKQIRQVLQRACRQNDPQTAAQALLDWAELIWPQQPPANLTALARQLPHAREALLTLDRVLYSAPPNQWRGDVLWRAVKSGLKTDKTPVPAQQHHLPPLYPQRI